LDDRHHYQFAFITNSEFDLGYKNKHVKKADQYQSARKIYLNDWSGIPKKPVYFEKFELDQVRLL